VSSNVHAAHHPSCLYLQAARQFLTTLTQTRTHAHMLVGVSPGKDCPTTVTAYIECVPGEGIKYEVNTHTHSHTRMYIQTHTHTHTYTHIHNPLSYAGGQGHGLSQGASLPPITTCFLPCAHLPSYPPLPAPVIFFLLAPTPPLGGPSAQVLLPMPHYLRLCPPDLLRCVVCCVCMCLLMYVCMMWFGVVSVCVRVCLYHYRPYCP
jgi:hypothetical protein